MTAVPIPLDAGKALCADIAFLPLVDAAAAKPGGRDAQKMKNILCRNCEVREVCANWAMTHPEVGVWGGTSPKTRTQRGAPSAAHSTPMHRRRAPRSSVA